MGHGLAVFNIAVLNIILVNLRSSCRPADLLLSRAARDRCGSGPRLLHLPWGLSRQAYRGIVAVAGAARVYQRAASEVPQVRDKQRQGGCKGRTGIDAVCNIRCFWVWHCMLSKHSINRFADVSCADPARRLHARIQRDRGRRHGPR